MLRHSKLNWKRSFIKQERAREGLGFLWMRPHVFTTISLHPTRNLCDEEREILKGWDGIQCRMDLSSDFSHESFEIFSKMVYKKGIS